MLFVSISSLQSSWCHLTISIAVFLHFVLLSDLHWMMFFGHLASSCLAMCPIHRYFRLAIRFIASVIPVRFWISSLRTLSLRLIPSIALFIALGLPLICWHFLCERGGFQAICCYRYAEYSLHFRLMGIAESLRMKPSFPNSANVSCILLVISVVWFPCFVWHCVQGKHSTLQLPEYGSQLRAGERLGSGSLSFGGSSLSQPGVPAYSSALLSRCLSVRCRDLGRCRQYWCSSSFRIDT